MVLSCPLIGRVSIYQHKYINTYIYIINKYIYTHLYSSYIYIYIHKLLYAYVIPKDHTRNYPPEWPGQKSGSNFTTTALEENRPQKKAPISVKVGVSPCSSLFVGIREAWPSRHRNFPRNKSKTSCCFFFPSPIWKISLSILIKLDDETIKPQKSLKSPPFCNASRCYIPWSKWRTLPSRCQKNWSYHEDCTRCWDCQG